MVAVGCMAIRSDRQVQGDAITGLSTRPRPKPGIGLSVIMAVKQSLS